MAVGTATAGVSACLAALGMDAAEEAAVVSVRHNSRVSRVRSGGRVMAVKECRVHTTALPDAEGAESEYGALLRLAHAAEGAGRRPPCPLPLVLCREHGAYAMTWTAGRTATRRVLAIGCSKVDARSLGTLTGRWLLGFHRLHALPDRCSDFVAKLAYVEDVVRRAGDREPVLAAAAGALRDTAARCARIEMPASWVHGDMKTDNVLIDEDAAIGIDARLLDENTVAYDLAPFLNHVRLLRWSARGWPAAGKLDVLAAGFLDAYDRDWIRWAPALGWLRCYMLLQRLASAAASARWHEAPWRMALRFELLRAVRGIEGGRAGGVR